jgi:hypothetical protein
MDENLSKNTSANKTPTFPPVEDQPVQVPKLFKQRRLSIKTISFALILVILMAAAGLLFYQNQQLKNQLAQVETQPLPATTPHPTADWKTYKSQSFIFKYPNNFQYVTLENGVVYFFGNQNDYDNCKEYLESNIKKIDNPCLNTAFVFNGYKRYAASKFEQDFKNDYSFSPDGQVTYVDNLNRPWITDYFLGEVFNFAAYTQIGDSYHAVFFQNKQEDREFFNQILSTFEFLEENETSDWKTYNNTEYGYTIKHPSDFKTQALAAGAGSAEAPANARSLYIYSSDAEEPYTNRYISLEVLGLEPTFGDEWTKTSVSLGGKTATKLVNSKQASNFDIYVVQLDNKQGVLEIYVSNTQDKKSLSNQMLSSFEFIN